jgi:hypothetical protein
VITKLERNVDFRFRILVFILQFIANIKVLYVVTKSDEISRADDLALLVKVQRENIFSNKNLFSFLSFLQSSFEQEEDANQISFKKFCLPSPIFNIKKICAYHGGRTV